MGKGLEKILQGENEDFVKLAEEFSAKILDELEIGGMIAEIERHKMVYQGGE